MIIKIKITSKFLSVAFIIKSSISNSSPSPEIIFEASTIDFTLILNNKRICRYPVLVIIFLIACMP